MKGISGQVDTVTQIRIVRCSVLHGTAQHLAAPARHGFGVEFTFVLSAVRGFLIHCRPAVRTLFAVFHNTVSLALKYELLSLVRVGPKICTTFRRQVCKSFVFSVWILECELPKITGEGLRARALSEQRNASDLDSGENPNSNVVLYQTAVPQSRMANHKHLQRSPGVTGHSIPSRFSPTRVKCPNPPACSYSALAYWA
jgi:hypothetical protein